MFETPVPSTYSFSWSHSSLTTYDTCPYRFWAEKVAKVAVDTVQHPTTVWGLSVHKALEDNGKDQKPLPDSMKHYQDYASGIAALASRALSVSYEFKMGVSRGFQPVEFTSPEAWGRCIADTLFIYPENHTAIVLDHKLGKYRGPTSQAVINAKMIMAHYPQVEIVKTSFNYLVADKAVNDVFYRGTIDDDFGVVARLIAAVEHSIAFENFPARKNGLCRQYCPVHTCAFNGKFKK